MQKIFKNHKNKMFNSLAKKKSNNITIKIKNGKNVLNIKKNNNLTMKKCRMILNKFKKKNQKKIFYHLCPQSTKKNMTVECAM